LDWLRQSVRDLEQASDSLGAERHEWACFAAHQSAEKAVKALHLAHGQEAWGHVIRRLLDELPSAVAVPTALTDKARVLDNYYVPSRYPNGHAEGAPFEHFGALQSEQAIRYAGEIVEFVRAHMALGGDGS
jgi:HEPN domain-containing protein